MLRMTSKPVKNAESIGSKQLEDLSDYLQDTSAGQQSEEKRTNTRASTLLSRKIRDAQRFKLPSGHTHTYSDTLYRRTRTAKCSLVERRTSATS